MERAKNNTIIELYAGNKIYSRTHVAMSTVIFPD